MFFPRKNRVRVGYSVCGRSRCAAVVWLHPHVDREYRDG